MEVLIQKRNKLNPSLRYIITIGLLLLIPVLSIVFGSFGEKYYLIISLSLMPFLILSVFDIKLIFSFLILSIFISFSVERIGDAAFVSSLFVVSLLITTYKTELKEANSPVLIAFFIYILSTLPSFINNQEPFKSLIVMTNLFVLLLLVFAISNLKDYNLESRFLLTFLSVVFINGLYIIYIGITTQVRAFGFTGIMYVDYVGIAIVISIVGIMLTRFSLKLFFILLTMFFTIASMLTQTRNPWITIFITSFFLMIFLYRNSRRFKLSRNLILTFFGLFVITIVVLFLSIKTINPKVTERATQLTSETKEGVINQEGKATSSLASRLLIWDTAINAFMEHPIVGIGVYSFPYSSQRYYSIPKFLFDAYVVGRSPHQGFLGILTETGIVGLIGFLIFFITSLRYVFRIYHFVTTRKELFIATSLVWALVYIFISLFLTDAWFWGNGIVLWGIILGLNVSYQKTLSGNKNNKPTPLIAEN